LVELSALFHGFAVVLSPYNMLLMLIGIVLGVIIGVLPGLGGANGVAILLPLTFSMAQTEGGQTSAIILLSCIYWGALFGGAITSILFNIPGEPWSVATTFDGYPMAQKGMAGKALTIAAIASFAGGTLATVLLMIFAPALSSVALLFHSAEYFALMVVGLSAIAAFAGQGQVGKALMMTILGLIMGTVGEGALSNTPRFTFGIMDLQSGFNFITLAMAMFALPEALFLVMNPARAADQQGGKITGLRITRAEARTIAPVIGRQSIQGFFIGVLPGAGATIASFLGYAVERNLATKEEQAEFGKGSIKGLAAPETANNAACTGSFVPLLTLGIPGSGTTAILLGALIALNVTPGPRLMTDEPDVFWAVIISMYIGNLVLLILNLPLIPYIAKILAIPRNYLIPFILFFTLMGSYIGQNNSTELLILVAFGVCATILRFANYPLAPLLIGFILGTMLEDNFSRAMQLYRGFGFLLERPMTLALLTLAAILVVLPSYRAMRARRRAMRAQGVAEGD
jgi:putative tricarboxylic transport membrane protein